MDVALSILAGLGLRLFFNSITDAERSNQLPTALLGLWEGVVLHQLSGRSSSPQLDHFLAYGLRLAVDLLITKNVQKTIMVILWSALATLMSEAVAPHAVLQAAIKKERERERRHRHSRSAQIVAPIISTPLPPRVRAYKPPEPAAEPPITTPPLLPPQPLLQSSTPLLPTERPPTPPSFFLQEQENSDIYSPSPKPVLVQSMHPEPVESSPPPARPQSGLASMFERSPDSGSPLPVALPLPTPPDSAQSAVPSDGILEIQDDSLKPRFEHQLYTIPEKPEVSSSEDQSTPGAQPQPLHEVAEDIGVQDAQGPSQSTTTANAPLPVPNAGLRRIPSGSVSRWLASTSNPNVDTIFATRFSPSTSPAAPLPVRLHTHTSHPQDPFWQIRTPIDDERRHDDGFLPRLPQTNGHTYPDTYPDDDDDSESDELRTPGVRQALDMETDNEHDPDPLMTPQHLRPPVDEDVLSPLALDMRSGLDELSNRPDSAGVDSDPQPEPASGPEDDDIAVPSSISQNMLLQPPLPPSGPLFRRPTPPPETPPPPSPSTIHSGMSDISILSTRIPNKLFNRANELRGKARDEEKLRAQLDDDRRKAEQEGRTMDALMLKVQAREKEREAQKLHEKAARRYYACMCPLFLSGTSN